MTTPDVLRLEKERDLYRGLLRLNARAELEPFLKEALELVVDVVEAEQGYIEIFERDAAEERSWWTAAGCTDEETQEIRELVSRGIIAEALGTGEVIVTPSALLDPRFRDRSSVRRSNIHAVLCAPIGKDPPLGVLYLQRRNVSDMFSDENKACAEIFVEHLAPLTHALFERRTFRGKNDPTRDFRKRLPLDHVIGSSKALADLFRELELVSPLDVCVLLGGETGAGKTQIARVIHAAGPRASGPFVEINCAAIPEPLMESELFGAMPGAHSTASRKIEGKVGAAKGGTLLLDEIAELTTTAQAKLLQLLQTRQYYPLGSSQPVTADVRLIAATNVDLRKAVAAKRFREDLFYRLQVLPIVVPSLAERREDIPALARHFCEVAQRTHKLRRVELGAGALRALSTAEWPGNVRELAHRVEAATIRASAEGAPQVEASHFGLEAPAARTSEFDGCTFQEGTRRYQRELLRATLDGTGGNVSETARRLDLARAHVYTLMKTLGLERD
ncbi:MAG TPA: sigma-54-dependent Fis family transcriptional regulator [Polyangiaceae bacterium]|nr:sigma-54-dependent Fis family transcriptional regulator [Polyangiaceae bacterium]